MCALWPEFVASICIFFVMYVGSLVEIDEHVNEIIQLCEEDIVQHTLQVLRFVLEY